MSSLTLDILHHYCGAFSFVPALLLSLASHTLLEGFCNLAVMTSIVAGLPNSQLQIKISAGRVCCAS